MIKIGNYKVMRYIGMQHASRIFGVLDLCDIKNGRTIEFKQRETVLTCFTFYDSYYTDYV